MNNSILGITMGNVIKHRDSRLVTRYNLFKVRTKLSHCKMVCRKSTSNNNE